VNGWSPLTIGIAAVTAGVLIAVGAAIYFKRRQKKDPAELERLRRIELGRTGRIVSGEITSLIEPDATNTAMLLVYRYDISGVTYEVSQDVSSMPAVASEAPHLVGRAISIKYEMKHPTNSIVVCEEWSGIRAASINGAGSGVNSEGSAGIAQKN
jgi:hypothetical protein